MSDEIAAASLWGRVKAKFQNLPGEHPTQSIKPRLPDYCFGFQDLRTFTKVPGF
jgi:hypothetical protein